MNNRELIAFFSERYGIKAKFLFWKRYFDQGYTMTNYVKYVIALFGLSSLNVKATLAVGLCYAVACIGVGYLWYFRRKDGVSFADIDTEISNKFNPFVGEMREKIK